MSDTAVFTIRLDRDTHRRLTDLAHARGIKQIDVVRDALAAYLGAAAIQSGSRLRMARISEFMQLAIDIIIREQYPEFRDRIVAETDKRLGLYHGA